MRTTINLPDEHLTDLKKKAAESGRTLTKLIEDALRESLARKEVSGKRSHPVILPTYGSGGVLPGVDLDNSAALLDLMESDTDYPGR